MSEDIKQPDPQSVRDLTAEENRVMRKAALRSGAVVSPGYLADNAAHPQQSGAAQPLVDSVTHYGGVYSDEQLFPINAQPPAEPAQPQQERKPLHDEYVAVAFIGLRQENIDSFRAGVRFAERHHGITSAPKDN